MNWKIGAIVIVLIASGCTSQTKDASSQAENTSLIEGSTTVYYTSAGFQPSEITVEKGTTVNFVNNASSPMWVGSNNHPSHRKYNGNSLPQHCDGNGPRSEDVFDQCTSGDKFSFTFDKTGEWGYHNHRKAADKGTVVVRAQN